MHVGLEQEVADVSIATDTWKRIKQKLVTES